MALILFVEYHSAFRQAASYVMDQEPDLEVVAQGGSVAEGRRLRPNGCTARSPGTSLARRVPQELAENGPAGSPGPSPRPYASECVEGLFSEVGLPLNGVLRSSQRRL